MSIDIPSSYVLNEINRVLICAFELSKDSKSCSVKSLIALCSSFSFGGRLVNFFDVIKLCDYINFLNYKSGKVSLSSQGLEFLKLNSKYYYEINDQQKSFIAENVMFLGPWRSRLRNLFLKFSPNSSMYTFEASIVDTLIWEEHQSLIQLLIFLGVISKKNGSLFVTPVYVAFVGILRAEQTGKTDEELKALLLANEKLANQAEDAVLEFEKMRLQNLGRIFESSLVKKISKLNINAGYDIQSFDGDQLELDFNRFIEVKASINTELRFFWSSNERRVATQLGRKYWIYFVGGGEQSAENIIPIMIQDPIKKISEFPELSEEADRYIVKLENMLNLKSYESQKIKGYFL